MKRLIAIALFLGCLKLLAKPAPTRLPQSEPEPSASETAPLFQGAAGLKTVFPLYLGFEGNALFINHLEVGLGYGITPGFYASTIGSVASSIGGKSAYKDLVEAAFQKNSAFRLHLQYNFRGKAGWRLGVAASRLSSEGSAPIDTVLAATTGNDFTNLKNLLIAAGKSPDCTMSTTLFSLEIYGGYSFALAKGLHLSTAIGFQKLLSPSVTLTTALPNFNASANGKALLSSSESQIETILTDYGYAPTATLALDYWF